MHSIVENNATVVDDKRLLTKKKSDIKFSAVPNNMIGNIIEII